MLKNINSIDKLDKNDLMLILKNEASRISIMDYMKASEFLRSDAQYIPPNYRRAFLESYVNAFITSLNVLKNDKNNYIGNVDIEELLELLVIIKNQQQSVDDENETCYFKFSRIISVYRTYILNEPIHPVGTPFPGGLEVKINSNKFLCPVKDKQKENSNAVCLFCIAKQDPDLK